MWLVLIGLVVASEVPLAAEGGVGVAFPHAGLGLAPAVRLTAGAEVIEHIQIGVDLDWRLPGTTTVTLNDPALDGPVEFRTGQWVGAVGARGDYVGGDPEGFGYRGGLTLGAARIGQKIRGDHGVSTESRGAIWLRPEAAALVGGAGPGQVAAGLYWSLVPGNIDTLGGAGNVLGLHLGYRMTL